MIIYEKFTTKYVPKPTKNPNCKYVYDKWQQINISAIMWTTEEWFEQNQFIHHYSSTGRVKERTKCSRSTRLKPGIIKLELQQNLNYTTQKSKICQKLKHINFSLTFLISNATNPFLICLGRRCKNDTEQEFNLVICPT